MYGNNGKLIINEVMANNTSTKIVDNMDYYDYIELYNGNNFDLPFIKYEFNRIGEDIDFLSFNCFVKCYVAFCNIAIVK